MCRKRLSSPRCRSELIESAWVVIVPGQKCMYIKKMNLFIYLFNRESLYPRIFLSKATAKVDTRKRFWSHKASAKLCTRCTFYRTQHVCPLGLLSVGAFIRWGFYPWGFLLRGFCPRGFCPRGFCPRGFCPRPRKYTEGIQLQICI